MSAAAALRKVLTCNGLKANNLHLLLIIIIAYDEKLVQQICELPVLQEMWERVVRRDAGQPEFLQAVHEVLGSLEPMLKRRPELLPLLERLCEPDRSIMFRVGMQWSFATRQGTCHSVQVGRKCHNLHRARRDGDA